MTRKIDYCYHTHTARCGHAVGEDREYVESAIQAGIKELGFSDHIFVPGFIQKGIRGNYDELSNYVDSIRSLKKEYKDKINIHVGFEAEYADCLKPYFKKLLKDGTVDYLICGQHMFFDSPTSAHWVFEEKNIVKMAKKYVKVIKKAIKSGLFAYIAHPDLFMCDALKNEPYFNVAIRKICKCALKYDMPLEINLHGIINRKKYEPSEFRYPCLNFFKIAKEYGNKIIIGIDAHNPKEFISINADEAEYIIKEIEGQLIDRVRMYNEK